MRSGGSSVRHGVSDFDIFKRKGTNPSPFYLKMHSISKSSNGMFSSFRIKGAKSSINLLQHQEDVFLSQENQIITEGEGNTNAAIEKIAEEKPMTTANIDRWKRTFQAVRLCQKDSVDTKEDTQSFYRKALKTQILTFYNDPNNEEFLDSMANRRVKKSPFIFHPESRPRVLWDIFGIIFIIFQAIIVPYSISFTTSSSNFGWEVFIIIMDFFFIIDILVTANTGLYIDGSLVMLRSEILLAYIKSWLALDIIASFPYSLIIYGTFLESNPDQYSSSIYYEAPKLLRLLKLFRMFRLLRVIKMQEILIKFEEEIMSEIFNLGIKFLKLFISILFLAHWMACIFYLISREDSEETCEAFIYRNNLINESNYVKYITFFYWAITTMVTVGYGDIYPVTANEKVCVMVCMLVSCVMFAYIVSSIGELVTQSSAAADKMRDTMVNINKFLIYRRIPKEMRMKVRRYLEYEMEEKEKIQMDEEEMMSLLSTPLKDEITIFYHGTILQSCPIFDDFAIDFLSYLTFFMHTEHFSAGDTIFEEEESSSKMFFIVKGKVLVYTRLPLTVLSELGEDNYFGEIGFFGNKPRSASVESLSFTQLLSISHDSLEKVAKYFPAMIKTIENIFQELNKGKLSVLQVKCYFCGELGHIANDCPQFDDYSAKKKQMYIYELHVLRKKIRAAKAATSTPRTHRKLFSSSKFGFEKNSPLESEKESLFPADPDMHPRKSFLNTVDLHVSSEKDSSIVGLKTEKLNSRPIHLSFNDTQEQKNDHISLLLLNRPEKKYILKFPNKEN